MCKARDVAMAMIKKSILLAQESGHDAYYLDFVKLHKLMFLAQCHILFSYDLELFQEKISAHSCGPYVEGINFIPITYGFDKIKNAKDENGHEPPHLPLSLTREETVELVLKKYGHLSTREIVSLTKQSFAYKVFEGNCEEKPTIPHEIMKITGKALSELEALDA